MGVASLVLGIVALVVGFIPCCGMLAVIPAVIGFILGIIDVVKKGKTGSSKGMGIAGIVLSVIAILVIIVWVLIIGTGSTVADDGSVTTSSSVTNNTSSSSTTQSEEKKEYNVGETYTDNNLKISYISSNSNYTGYNKYAEPASGNKIIRAEIAFENISNSDISLDNIDCYADDLKCESYYYSEDYKSPSLETISSGKKFTSVVYFEVPKNSQKIVLEYEPDIWSSEKVIFVVQ